MSALWENLQNLLFAVFGLLAAIWAILLPWLPLILFVAYCLYAVNWATVHEILGRGGWIPLVLIAIGSVVVWQAIAPEYHFNIPGTHLDISSGVSKVAAITAITCLALFCGSSKLVAQRPNHDT